ncbi:hypothetical protein NC652_039316 [Populus alba x Populus x berolinensis]|nr:hypothetical protein NC652_039316 [Populus alba x Populus x berolinensis]
MIFTGDVCPLEVNFYRCRLLCILSGMLFKSCSSRPTNQFYRFVRYRVFTLVEQHGLMAKRMAANPIDPLDPIMPRHYFMFISSAYALSLGKVSRILAGLTRSVYLLPDLYT